MVSGHEHDVPSLSERKAVGIVPKEAFTETRVGEGIRSEKGQFQIIMRPMSLVLEHVSALQAERLQIFKPAESLAGMAPMSPLTSLLKHARETVDECLPSNVSTKQASTDGLDGRLNEVLFAAAAAGHGSTKPELSVQDKADIWHIVCKLWVRNSSMQRA